MGRSKPMYRPRCSKCGSKYPTPLSVKQTKEHDYVTLQCGCGYKWVSNGESALRLAVGYKLVTYGTRNIVS
jgi:DNA-directed RNA polymerase subunit RPC12/RpoP